MFSVGWVRMTIYLINEIYGNRCVHENHSKCVTNQMWFHARFARKAQRLLLIPSKLWNAFFLRSLLRRRDESHKWKRTTISKSEWEPEAIYCCNRILGSRRFISLSCPHLKHVGNDMFAETESVFLRIPREAVAMDTRKRQQTPSAKTLIE